MYRFLLPMLAVLACHVAVPAVAGDESLEAFFERVVAERRVGNPQAQASHYAGTDRAAEYLGRLQIPAPENSERELARDRRHLRELRRHDAAALSGQQAVSHAILEWTLDQGVRGADFLWHDYPVNQLMSYHNLLPGYMLNQHPMRSESDLDFYLRRLGEFPAVFTGAVREMEMRRGQGILPPRFAVEKSLRDAREFIDMPAADNPLAAELLARIRDADWLGDARREGLAQELADAVAEEVYPGYRILIDYLESILPEADSNDGVWRLPDGDAYYRWVLRGHTTTDLAPGEIHELGLAEVERIESAMDEILCEQDYCDGGVGERMAALGEEDRFRFEDSDAGREAILAAYRDIVAEIEAGLDGWFHEGPKRDIQVRRVPEYRQETSFGAYYMRPAADGSRPGTFFVNLRNVAEHPRFGLRTLAYHESIPGHHLQITHQQAMDDVPAFRRDLSLHAHAEGWALYAEALAAEMGFHDDPFDNLGRLRGELFRAVRLVVDTGMHHHRWSRERAIDYMHRVTGMPMSDVVAEIERYLVIPGQACAFKVGMMRIQELRARARDALGEDFDVRDFHQVILENGAMPLAVLEDLVDAWIMDRQ